MKNNLSCKIFDNSWYIVTSFIIIINLNWNTTLEKTCGSSQYDFISPDDKYFQILSNEV